MSSISIGLIARYPHRGQVKTRLAATIGDDDALTVYEALLTYTVTVLKNAKATSTRVVAFVADANDLRSFARDYPGIDAYDAQIEGDLGMRMSAALSSLLNDGPALLIGADCPELTAEDLNAAIALLDTHDCVLGPSHDGGYYLIGMQRLLPDLLVDMPWSSDRVYILTRERLDAIGASVGLLPIRRDIDTYNDLVELHDRPALHPLADLISSHISGAHHRG